MKLTLNLILLICLLLVPFVPYFGAIDKIASQWLYLSIINILLLFTNIYEFNFLSLLRRLLKIPHFFSYFLFLVFVIISFFYTKNITLSLVDFSRIVIVFFSVLNISIFFSKYNFNLYYFSCLVSFILFIEILVSIYPLINFLLFNDLQLLDYGKLQLTLLGVSGNRNVLAFDIVFKLPFVLVFLLMAKNKFKLLPSILLFLSSFVLILLSSRGALISLTLVSIFFVFHIFYSKTSFKYLLFIIPILFSIFLTNLFNENKYNIVSKVSSIGLSDESTSHRLFLYENAYHFILHNPIIGCGIGNWKVESLPYWKDRLSGYTIPYHAHNDFLELSTEVGVIGGFCYLFFFLTVLYLFLIRYYKNPQIEFFLILLTCLIYFFDANINFPMERALSQVNFIILMSLSLIYYNNIDGKVI